MAFFSENTTESTIEVVHSEDEDGVGRISGTVRQSPDVSPVTDRQRQRPNSDPNLVYTNVQGLTPHKVNRQGDGRCLDVLCLNVQSLRNKLTAFDAFLQTSRICYGVLCITEHFLSKDEVGVLTVPGYRVATAFCRRNMRHGGVLLMCRDGIDFKVREDIGELSVETVCELAALELRGGLVIVALYRPPGSDVDCFMSCANAVLNKVSRGDARVIVGGDFNINFLRNSHMLNTFKCLLSSYDFGPVVDVPTRQNSCIDNILVNFDANLFKWNVIDPGLSDHMAVTISVSDMKFKQMSKYIMTRGLSDAGMFHFYTVVESADWSFINDDALDVADRFHRFIELINNYVDLVFPMKKVKVESNKRQFYTCNWFSPELGVLRDKVRLLSELYQLYPCPELLHCRNAYRGHYRRMLDVAKRNCYVKYIDKASNKVKAYWDVINNHRVNKRSSTVTHLSADTLNRYFLNVAGGIGSQLPSPNPCYNYIKSLDSDVPGFKFNEVSFNVVRNLFDRLGNKNSYDTYGVNMRLLKVIKNLIIVPVTKLINLCIRNAVYPDMLKISKVIPLHKGGEVSNEANFRPISVLPCIGKIFECVLNDQIVSFFESYRLFSDSQFGFRRAKGVDPAVEHLTDLFIDAMESGSYAGAIFCDLKKAFDCVAHHVLLEKLKHYNFDCRSRELLKSYFQNRYQYTYVNNEPSTLGRVTCGVPQGSVLGPTLFLIYINDIKACVPGSDLLLFADDTTLVLSDANLTQLKGRMIERQLEIKSWLNANSLCLNEGKTKHVFFSHRYLSDDDCCTSVRFLGLCLDSALSWEGHVDYLSGKISQNIYVIRNLVKMVPGSLVLGAYHALILSHCSYGLLSWGHSPHMKRVFALQRKVVRVITGLEYRADVRGKFIELRLCTLPSLYIYLCLRYVRRNIDSYNVNSEFHDYVTRSAPLIRGSYLRLSSSRKGTNYFAPKFFNLLPSYLKELPLGKFCAVIKKILIGNAFYSFEEYYSFDFATFVDQ